MSAIGILASKLGDFAWDLGTSAVKNYVNTGISYHYNKKLQEDSQAFNKEEAQLARDFSERMSNTAYQRSLADMREAGLNPNLLLGSSGASSPSSASASSSMASASGDSSTLSDSYLAMRSANAVQSARFRQARFLEDYKHKHAIDLDEKRSQNRQQEFDNKMIELKKFMKYNQNLHYKDFPELLKFLNGLK